MKSNNIATYMTVAFLGIFLAEFFAPINAIVIAVAALVLTISAMLGLATTKATYKFFHETELAGISVGILFFAFFLIHDSTAFHHAVDEIGVGGGWKSALAVVVVMSLVNFFSKDMFALLTWVDSKLPNTRFGNFTGLVLFQLMSSLIAQPGTAKMLAEFYLKRVNKGKEADFAVGLATGIGTGGGFLPFTAPAVAIVWGSMQMNGWTLAKYFLLIVPALILHVLWVSWKLSGMLANKDNRIEVLTTTELRNISFVLLVAFAQIVPMVYWLNVIMTLFGMAYYRYLFHPKANLATGEKQDFLQAIHGPIMIGFLMLAFVPIGAMCKPIFIELLIVIGGFALLWKILSVYFIIKGGSAISDNALLALIGCALPAAATSDVFVVAVVLGALAGGILLEGSNIPNIPIRQVFGVEKTEWPKRSLSWYLPSLVLFPAWIYLLTTVLK